MSRQINRSPSSRSYFPKLLCLIGCQALTLSLGFNLESSARAGMRTASQIQGKITELEKSAANIWVDKKHCNHSSTCDALVIERVSVRTTTGTAQLANLILMNDHLLNCQNLEPEGWGLKALVYAFSPRETWPAEDQNRIESIAVSEVTAIAVNDINKILVDISPNRNRSFGSGYFGKLQIKIKFSSIQEESAEIEDQCRTPSENIRSFTEKTLIYGGTIN